MTAKYKAFGAALKGACEHVGQAVGRESTWRTRGFARLDDAIPAVRAGTVWLVGAGPGAPGLISLLAYHALQSCDVVVYDALVNADILRWVKTGADLEYAGKRGGRPSPKQRDISLRLIELAHEGKRCCASKAAIRWCSGAAAKRPRCSTGRASVSHRARHNRRHGRASLRRNPVTHRDINHAVIFLTGHDESGAVPGSVDRAAVATAAPVIVMYMAVKHMGEIARALIAGGREASDNVVFVSNATLPQQTVLSTTLGEIDTFFAENTPETPAIVVVGQVERWRDILDWYGAPLRENPIG